MPAASNVATVATVAIQSAPMSTMSVECRVFRVFRVPVVPTPMPAVLFIAHHPSVLAELVKDPSTAQPSGVSASQDTANREAIQAFKAAKYRIKKCLEANKLALWRATSSQMDHIFTNSCCGLSWIRACATVKASGQCCHKSQKN